MPIRCVTMQLTKHHTKGVQSYISYKGIANWHVMPAKSQKSKSTHKRRRVLFKNEKNVF